MGRRQVITKTDRARLRVRLEMWVADGAPLEPEGLVSNTPENKSGMPLTRDEITLMRTFGAREDGAELYADTMEHYLNRAESAEAALAVERSEVTRLAVRVEAKIVENIWLEAHVAAVRAAVVALGDAANGESFAYQRDGNFAQARDWAVRGGVYRKVMNLLDGRTEGETKETGT